MSELNFNDLPPEILIKVFQLLDVVNLKNATLTCRLWTNLIESECRWPCLRYHYSDGIFTSNKMTPGYTAAQKMNFILTTSRKFETIEIATGRFSEDDKICKIFQKHGNNVVKLILSGCRFNHLVSFAELLNLTPNLKYTVIGINIREASDVPVDQVSPDLKKLKSLDMFVGDQRILKCFRKANLTTVKFWENGRSKHFDQFADFLSSQDMLKSLTVTNLSRSGSVLFELGKLDVPIRFRLTQLAITHMSDRMSSHGHNLLRFIETQAENLKGLKLGFNIPSSVYEYVFASMINLNNLSVSIREITPDNVFYIRLTENCSVRTIELLDFGIGDVQFLGDFLKKLPNIRSLIFPNTTNKNTFAAMAQSLNKLESLSMRKMGKGFIDLIKFPNLKALHIQNLWSKVDWNKFTKIHSRLTELTIVTIGNETCLTSDDIDQITSNVDLQTIRLGVGFVADDRFFEIIRTKCTNLKVLDLHRSCKSGLLRRNIEINRLRLCDDIKMTNDRMKL